MSDKENLIVSKETPESVENKILQENSRLNKLNENIKILSMQAQNKSDVYYQFANPESKKSKQEIMSTMKDRDFANAELDKVVKEKLEVEESIRKLSELKEKVSQNRYEEIIKEYKKAFEDLENSTIDEMSAKEDFLNSIGKSTEPKTKDKYIKAREKKEDDQIKFEKISKIKEELEKRFSKKREEKREEKKGITQQTTIEKEPLKTKVETQAQTKQLKKETEETKDNGGLTEDEINAEAPKEDYGLLKSENFQETVVQYKIKKGDKLSKISKKFGIDINDIMDSKGNEIKNKNLLIPGKNVQFRFIGTEEDIKRINKLVNN